MTCTACGAEVLETANFCQACGRKLGTGGPATRDAVHIRGSAQAGSVSGEVAGVRVSRVAAQTANFKADVIEVKLTDDQVAQLAKAVSIPSELKPPAAAQSEQTTTAAELKSMRESLDQVLARLEQAARAGGAAEAAKAGGVEVRRSELLVKKAILLTAEADQMVFDRVKQRSEFARRGTSQFDLADVFADWPGQTEYNRKLQAALELFDEASRLEPADTEVLLHLYQATARVSDDDAAGLPILYRIQGLLRDPKTEQERLHLAQATYLSAMAGPVPQPAALRTARAMFDRLGRADWVRACDEQIAAADDHAGSVPPAPLPHRAGPDFDRPMAVFDPVGRWQVAASDGTQALMELGAPGGFQGMHHAGPYAGAQLSGAWAFDRARGILQFQGLANGYIPFISQMAVTGQHAGAYLAHDAKGTNWQLRRID